MSTLVQVEGLYTPNKCGRWTALSGVFIVGVTSGGPPVMVFSFIGVSLLTLAVAIPMAEMCSMYPVAGGQYSWVAALTPPRFARGLSYATGWFMLIGIPLAYCPNFNFIDGADPVM